MTTSTFFGIPVNMPVAVDVLFVVFLTILSGTMAGLLLCIFSLDRNRLRAMAAGSNQREASQAKRLIKIL